MTLELRAATDRDAPPCAAILRDWILETDWFPDIHSMAQDTAFISGKIAKGEVTVAMGAGGTLAGFLALEDDYVSCLYVARDSRRQGVGKRLLDLAKQTRPRLSLWTFQANLAAQRFYLREGFAETQRTDGAENEEKLPDIEYHWPPGDAP